MGVFSRFLNCKNGTKSRKTSYYEQTFSKNFVIIVTIFVTATVTNFLQRDAIPQLYIIFIITPTRV